MERFTENRRTQTNMQIRKTSQGKTKQKIMYKCAKQLAPVGSSVKAFQAESALQKSLSVSWSIGASLCVIWHQWNGPCSAWCKESRLGTPTTDILVEKNFLDTHFSCIREIGRAHV